MDLTNTKEIIIALKEVYREKNLSIDKTLALVNEKVGEGIISRSTVQAVFAEGSENGSRQFGYDTVLKPLYIALLDIENIETDDETDIKALKAVLRLKKDIIDELSADLNSEKLTFYERLEEKTRDLQTTIDFLKNQILLKDERITDLIYINKELTLNNIKLNEQFINCPFKKE